jgi:hypothetical protein
VCFYPPSQQTDITQKVEHVFHIFFVHNIVRYLGERKCRSFSRPTKTRADEFSKSLHKCSTRYLTQKKLTFHLTVSNQSLKDSMELTFLKLRIPRTQSPGFHSQYQRQFCASKSPISRFKPILKSIAPNSIRCPSDSKRETNSRCVQREIERTSEESAQCPLR